MICGQCKLNNKCTYQDDIKHKRMVRHSLTICEHFRLDDGKPLTNAERIKSMSNDELMKFICNEIKNIAEMGTNELWNWLNSNAE